MTDILTNSASIPYGTWGGGRSLTQSKSISIPASNVPYTYGPLVSDIYISSDMTDVKPIVYIDNMVNYARYNISNYNTITSIPEEHSPNYINTSLAQNWSGAFSNCRKLTNLPNPFYDTSNATDMYRMFENSGYLTTIPNFDTSNVTNMRSMFSHTRTSYNYSNLTTIPNFDTSNVTDMTWMFLQCPKLAAIPNFDTSNVTNMHGMLTNCKSLTTVPNFDTSNVTSMSSMFANCTNLTTVPNFDTSNVTNMYEMFDFCRNLITIPNFDTSNVTDMRGIFHSCLNIQGNFYISSNKITRAVNLFYNAPNYTKNIYCHANTTTYNTIYANMGNNTYNSDWNAYLKTFENDPITKIQFLSNFSYSDETALQNQVSTTIFRSPVNRVYLRGYENQSTDMVIHAGPYLKIDPYTDYNLTTVFTHSRNESSGSGLELPIAWWVEYYISNNTTNTQIYNSANYGTSFLPTEKTMYFYLDGYYLAEGAEEPETPIDISNIK